MTSTEGAELFTQILNEYSEIKDPKYRNADVSKLHEYIDTLYQIKDCQEDFRAYQNLINGISQAIKHIENISNPDTEITLPASIEFSATNSSIKLIAKGIGTYSWTDGVSILGTIDMLIVTTVGSYSVTITGINGCSATSDLIKIKPVAPAAIPATFIAHAISNPSDISNKVNILNTAIN